MLLIWLVLAMGMDFASGLVGRPAAVPAGVPAAVPAAPAAPAVPDRVVRLNLVYAFLTRRVQRVPLANMTNSRARELHPLPPPQPFWPGPGQSAEA